eukprot:6391979-Amphidinium_carterae.1
MCRVTRGRCIECPSLKSSLALDFVVWHLGSSKQVTQLEDWKRNTSQDNKRLEMQTLRELLKVGYTAAYECPSPHPQRAEQGSSRISTDRAQHESAKRLLAQLNGEADDEVGDLLAKVSPV